MKWLLSAALLGTLALKVEAQVPAGPEQLMNEQLEDSQIPSSAACVETSACAVVWHDARQTDRFEESIYGRVLRGDGVLEPVRVLRSQDGGSNVSLSAHSTGFLLTWDGNRPDQEGFPTLLQELDHSLSPIAEASLWTGQPSSFLQLGLLGSIRTNLGYAVLWVSLEHGPPAPTCEGCELNLNLTLLDSNGLPLVGQRPVEDQPEQHLELGGDLASDAESRVLVSYIRFTDEGRDADVYLRRFSPLLTPMGPPIRVNEFLPGVQTIPSLALGPQGGFIIVWQSGSELVTQDGDREAILARRFSADGVALGGEFLVNNVALSSQRSPRIAMDPNGNFVVVWQSFDPVPRGPVLPLWDVKARLFRADGTPVGGEIFVNQLKHDEQALPKVAFAPNGTFFVTWYGPTPGVENGREDVYARRFSASVGEELCWLAGPLFSCDLARSGGLAEMTVWQGWTQGAVPLVGDFDGDGREDLCAYREGEFRCDLDHEGRPLEGVAAWGLLGDTPLLGDVKGDGRADPCVRRKRRLLCDTARDGGFSELQMALPSPIGTPLLGDVDGDGREDLCLFEAGLWSCKTWAQGSVQALFGGGGSQPALVDVDGDGLADFCVLDGQQLRCDTSRDGGAAEFQLELAVPAGARLLVGNLDGL